LDVEVTPGSRFEVVTPAAIAGVQGTRFKVIVTVEGELYCVKVEVKEGVVVLKDRWADGVGRVLRAHDQSEVKCNRHFIWTRLQKGWDKRRIRLTDDHLYESNGKDKDKDENASPFDVVPVVPDASETTDGQVPDLTP
jgi:hypothetical protein